MVAPSRVRGLKPVPGRGALDYPCRTLTGAWIETSAKPSSVAEEESHPHGCVD
ncbi:hypothetical protein HMPREF3038_02709 [Akkermansia sp. KLE1797]|nr:hypothetical protein HMPREF3038_02709 [Akkermansia sp. KLE1797]KZA03733.1 hypothetical protein HMPREF1326_02599 [Akkermansia sp. KLE1605]